MRRKSMTSSPGLPSAVVRNGLWSFCWVIKSPSSESEHPLYLFLSHVHVRTHRSTHSTGFREQKQTVLNAGYAGCWKALVICSLVSCLLSAVRCVDKTKGSPGKCKFSCTNLARVTFSQISFFKMFPSMPQFNKIVKLCPKCKIKCIQYIVSFAWIF